MNDLLHLRSILAVEELGSFTHAAKALAVTQPALSRRIQLLEEEFGTALLERSKRGAVLTEAGRLLCAEARILVDRYARAKESVHTLMNLQSGIVRLGGGATAVSYLVPTAIAQFSAKHPHVRFEVREQGSAAVEQDVLSERLELGIVTLPTRSAEMVARPLRKDKIVLVARTGHPLTCRKRIDVQDLQGRGFVAFESGSAIRKLIDDALRKAGVELSVQMELRSIAAILEMVAHTDMLAFVSALGVETTAAEVEKVDLRGVTIERRLAVIHKQGRPLSPAAEAFAGLLR